MREFGWFCASMLLGLVVGALLAGVVYWVAGGQISSSAMTGIIWGVVSLFMFEGGKKASRD
jgi:hypothetical protein